MVYVSPETAYMKRFKEFLAKKKRLAADEWGCDVKTVDHIFKPVDEWLLEEVYRCVFILLHGLDHTTLCRFLASGSAIRQCGPSRLTSDVSCATSYSQRSSIPNMRITSEI